MTPEARVTDQERSRTVGDLLDHLHDAIGHLSDYGRDLDPERHLVAVEALHDLTVNLDRLADRFLSLDPDTVLDGPIVVLHPGRVTVTIALLESLWAGTACSFDHHGGCQEHGYLSLQPGEVCPQHEVGEVLRSVASHPQETP